jgi:hypothetical protein
MAMFVEGGERNRIVVASATASVPPPTSTLGQMPASADSGLSKEAPDLMRNESAAIDVCRDYVEAQLKYFRSDTNADGIFAFAKRIRSTPGKRDGLYWAISDGEDESPTGPNVAAAAITEQQPSDKPRPLSGYYFKTLLAQGPAATGGSRNYQIDGLLLTGFALVAWPAQYGVSGVQSFIVNHLGDVYGSDLGPDTDRIASGLSAFDPDHNWTKVRVSQDR